MQRREIVPLPEHTYPPDDWRIVESRFSPDHVEWVVEEGESIDVTIRGEAHRFDSEGLTRSAPFDRKDS